MSFLLVFRPRRRGTARRSSRRPARTPPRSAGCAAPRRAPRRPTARRSRPPGTPRRSPGCRTRPRPGSRRWLTVSSIGSSMFSTCPSDSSTQARYSRRDPPQVLGRDPQLAHVPGVDREAAVGAPGAADQLERGVERVDVDVERHELVGDLRVGVLRRVVAQLGERLGQPVELARRAGDVADLDVVGVERGGGVEQQPARAVGLVARPARRSGRRSPPRNSTSRYRRPASSKIPPSRPACASRAGARCRRATARCPGSRRWPPRRSGRASRTGSTRARRGPPPGRPRSSTGPSGRRGPRGRRPRRCGPRGHYPPSSLLSGESDGTAPRRTESSHRAQAFLPISALAPPGRNLATRPARGGEWSFTGLGRGNSPLALQRRASGDLPARRGRRGGA